MVEDNEVGDKEERRKRQEGRKIRSLLSSYYGVGHSEDPTANDPTNIDRYFLLLLIILLPCIFK